MQKCYVNPLGVLSCDFDNRNWCGYQDKSFGTYSWKIHKGESPTYSLSVKGITKYHGPATDSHFSPLGRYSSTLKFIGI